MRLIVIFLLTVSLCTLSGATGSVQAVVENNSHASTCCPSDQPENDAGADHCASPECQCLSCLSIDLQEISIPLTGNADSDCTHHETAASLIGEHYRTIDYPPETA